MFVVRRGLRQTGALRAAAAGSLAPTNSLWADQQRRSYKKTNFRPAKWPLPRRKKTTVPAGMPAYLKRWLLPVEELPPPIDGSQGVIPFQPPALQCWVVSKDRKRVGMTSLSWRVFGQDFRPDLVWQVVRWQQHRARQGTHSAKTRGEVKGTGKKPWPQKGTGRARAKDRRGPQFRGGGKAHPPKPRSHAYHLPPKVRHAALRSALSERFREGGLHVVDHLHLLTPKSGELRSMLENWRVGPGDRRLLIVYAEDDKDLRGNMKLAGRNFRYVEFIPASFLNTWDVMRHKYIWLSPKAKDTLQVRLVHKPSSFQRPAANVRPELPEVHEYYPDYEKAKLQRQLDELMASTQQ